MCTILLNCSIMDVIAQCEGGVSHNVRPSFGHHQTKHSLHLQTQTQRYMHKGLRYVHFFYWIIWLWISSPSVRVVHLTLLYPVSFPEVKRFFEITQKRGKISHNNYNKKLYSAHPLTFCSLTFFHKINNKENVFIRRCNFSFLEAREIRDF